MRPVRLLAILAGIAAAALAGWIALDPDGPRRVEPSAASPLRVEFARRIEVSKAPARQVAFSPDGHRLAASSADGSIVIWNWDYHGRYRRLVHEGGATSIAFSGDGRLLVSGGYDGKIRLWRVEDGRPLRTLAGHDGTVWAVDISPDGERVASGGEDKLVRLWSTRDGSLIKTMPGHKLNIWSIRFAPDGRTVASSSFDHDIRLWHVLTGEPLRTLEGHEEAVVGIDISGDGSFLASGSDDSSVGLWRLRDGVRIATLRGSNHVYAVAISANGRWLASGGRAHGALRTLWNQATGMGGSGPAVRLWRVADGRTLQTLDLPTDVTSVAFSPDGRWLAAAGEDGSLSLWFRRGR